MATIRLKFSKDLDQYDEIIKQCGIYHMYNRSEQLVIGKEKVDDRKYFKKNDAVRTHNGCISCVVSVMGYYSEEYYYIILANNKLDIMTYMGMCEKLIPFMVNEDEILSYRQRKPMIDNDLYEHLTD